jgi:hypothetical protein
MMYRYGRALAGCVILAATDACGHSRRTRARPSLAPTTVVFTNESLDQADVFAVRAGAGWLRLGTVMAGHTDTLTIRAGALPPGASVDFVARLLARSLTPHSGPVTVQPGDWLAITLPMTANSLAVLPAREP